MIRMLIVGYCYGIRSERRLCEEAHLNLAYCWFCRLSLEDKVPNHATFSKNRHGRFRDSYLFRWLFNEVLRHCMDAGLVKGEGFAVDASIIKADASRQRGVPGDEPVNWSDPALSTRAVREYLEALDEEALAETLPKRLSLTARWTAAPGGPAFYAYSTNYLIDTEHGVIMDVEPTPAHRTAEVESTTSATPLTVPRRCLPGWWRKNTSGHMCRCGTKLSARTTAFRVTISTGMKRPRNIAAQPATYYAANGEPSERAFARHQSQHHHLPLQADRLRDMSDESQVLPEHSDSQDRPQRP
ncbi:putative transposase, truncated [Pseudomonas fluorescens Pf0-1]|uniref:Putative transposase, truncated n=1 Tax=Pseudomonas fluorescens (strain Pf0-1) TaxID=205922 RepID=Q3KBQ6_PSEPF|nr:putative transposase, truncated [Pseudomonas fluorescens Pf0-1]